MRQLPKQLVFEAQLPTSGQTSVVLSGRGNELPMHAAGSMTSMNRQQLNSGHSAGAINPSIRIVRLADVPKHKLIILTKNRVVKEEIMYRILPHRKVPQPNYTIPPPKVKHIEPEPVSQNDALFNHDKILQ